jgi:hypothetical protein
LLLLYLNYILVAIYLYNSRRIRHIVHTRKPKIVLSFSSKSDINTIGSTMSYWGGFLSIIVKCNTFVDSLRKEFDVLGS